MSQIIVITGASSGFGNLTAKALAHAGHTVYGGTREVIQNNKSAKDMVAYAQKDSVDLRPVELNVLSEQSLQGGVNKIIKEAGRIDVLIHNASHMTYGPTEAFTPEQLMAEYDLNCVGSELTQWGIETSIIIPGAYSKGTSHFAHATSPEDKAVAAQYAEGPYKGYDKKVSSP